MNISPASKEVCKKEDWSHILRCEGTKNWKGTILDQRFRGINAEICITRITGCKNKQQWQKTGTHMVTREQLAEINGNDRNPVCYRLSGSIYIYILLRIT
jgi:hypothetical protein